MPSQKTIVVDHLWDVLNAENRTTVTFQDVREAIEFCNREHANTLKTDNPANFMKDLLRGANASSNWPERLKQMRVTGRQITGQDRIFEFIPYGNGQIEPFPNPFEPQGSEQEFVIQSLSMPLATKSLGRTDESWLIQVAVQLKVLESHFANLSQAGVIELTHLQTGVKLNRTEIDSLFLAVIDTGSGGRTNALVTCEAKQQKDPILGSQVIEQVASAYASVRNLDLKIEAVIPIALKALKDRAAIYVAEFEPWTANEAMVPEGERKELIVSCSAVYRLTPPVPGIGHTPKRPRAVGKKPGL